MLKKLAVAAGLMALAFSPAQAAERFELAAGIFGGTQYQYCYALSEVIKQKNASYELLPVETTGSPASLIKALQKPKSSIFANSMISFVDASHGKPPYPKSMDNIKLIGFVTENVQTLITYNDKIKTVADISGKRFVTTGVMSTSGKHFWNIISRAIPNSNKMKPIYSNWSGVQNGLLDGTADVGALGVTVNANGSWMPVPAYAEIVASKGNPSFITLDESYIKDAAKAHDQYYIPVVMPKGSIAENVPPKDIVCFDERLGIAGFTDTPDDLAYTIAKILCEEQEEMAKYTPVGKLMSVKITVPGSAFPDSMIHPGALRYYKEKGLR